MKLDEFMEQVECIAEREGYDVAVIYADGTWRAATGTDFFSAFEKETHDRNEPSSEVERLWQDPETP